MVCWERSCIGDGRCDRFVALYFCIVDVSVHLLYSMHMYLYVFNQ